MSGDRRSLPWSGRVSPWKIQSVGGRVALSPPGSWLFTECVGYLPAGITNSRYFEKLFWPRVYSIDLRDVTEKIDSAIRTASGFPNLRELVLYQSCASDDDVELIAKCLPHLRALKLNETSVTNAAVSHLCQMSNLRLLNIQRTAISNSSINDLLAIPRLRELLIGETKIDSTGITRLRAEILIVRTRMMTVSRCRTCRQPLSYCRCGRELGDPQ